MKNILFSITVGITMGGLYSLFSSKTISEALIIMLMIAVAAFYGNKS